MAFAKHESSGFRHARLRLATYSDARLGWLFLVIGAVFTVSVFNLFETQLLVSVVAIVWQERTDLQNGWSRWPSSLMFSALRLRSISSTSCGKRMCGCREALIVRVPFKLMVCHVAVTCCLGAEVVKPRSTARQCSRCTHFSGGGLTHVRPATVFAGNFVNPLVSSWNITFSPPCFSYVSRWWCVCVRLEGCTNIVCPKDPGYFFRYSFEIRESACLGGLAVVPLFSLWLKAT